MTDNPFRMLVLQCLIGFDREQRRLATGEPRKNSLDSRSRWGILADIEFWSKARLSQNLDLGHFRFGN